MVTQRRCEKATKHPPRTESLKSTVRTLHSAVFRSTRWRRESSMALPHCADSPLGVLTAATAAVAPFAPDLPLLADTKERCYFQC